MEDGPSRPSSTTLQIARLFSVVGNPLFLIPLTIGAVTLNWRWMLIIACTTTLPLLVITARKVRSGHWSNFDVSRQDQRLGLYLWGTPLFLLAALVLYLSGASPRMMQGVAAGGLLFFAGMVGNRFLKISMHMMFSTFGIVLIVRTWPWSAIGMLPFLAGIAWSRLVLERHTRAEVLVGATIGLVAGVLAVM